MIRRSYMCPDCAHRWEIELRSDQWDAPLPSCPACDAREVQQEFAVPAIGGSLAARAAAITEDIMRKDYNVANYTGDNREGGVNKVRYNDQSPAATSSWAGGMLEQAIQIGRQTRREGGGSGLDILQRSIKSGAQVDLIEASKRKAMRVW